MGFAVDAGYGIVIWIAIFALIGLSSIGPLPMAARSRGRRRPRKVPLSPNEGRSTARHLMIRGSGDC